MQGVCEANPDEKFRLMSHGLGAAFSMCGGWPSAKLIMMVGSASKRARPSSSQSRSRSSRKCNRRVWNWRMASARHRRGARAVGREWRAGRPAVLSPYDLKDAYEKVGQMSKEVAARGPKVLEIRMIAKHMMDEPKEFPNPWRAVKFVPSPDAIRLATELAQAAA